MLYGKFQMAQYCAIIYVPENRMKKFIAIIATVLMTSAVFTGETETTFESVQQEFQQKAISLLSAENVAQTKFTGWKRASFLTLWLNRSATFL